ncbi:MAG: pyridoxal phosphate-dependent aminotransferase [Clostridium sp.]|nr:pyridoxal phosphate-dependent aminotransferase [Clostridium sp.]MDY3827339.1 pyridoxal phosphate-dependent aminotransferase [Clostridium sp.]
MEYSRKAQSINPSVTLAITAKAKELKSKGVDVITFGVGEPDFNTPENIIEAANKAMKDGKTKYTPVPGIPELRKAIVNKFKQDNGLDYEEAQIIVSTGAKQSLNNAFMAILNPGDEVIVPTPYWVSYPELIRLAEGVPVFVENKKEDDYKYTLETLEKAVTSKTKAIILNDPNNPTGSIYSKEELEMIAEFAKKYDLVIISDEIYEKLIYDGNKHVSIASLSEDAKNRTIVINGFSKSFAMTGWRVGYSASNKEIAKLMSSLQSHMTSNVNSIAQYASVEALEGSKDDLNHMISVFEQRRNLMVKMISEMKDVSIIKPSGAFYVMMNIENYFNKKINGNEIKNSLDFSNYLLDEAKVAVVPGIAFGLDSYVRLSYATSEENIKEGLSRINEFLKKIQ